LKRGLPCSGGGKTPKGGKKLAVKPHRGKRDRALNGGGKKTLSEGNGNLLLHSTAKVSGGSKVNEHLEDNKKKKGEVR